MTKRELLQELEAELECKGNVYKLDENKRHCNKNMIQIANKCLRARDEEMADYLTVIKLKYPNIYRTVTTVKLSSAQFTTALGMTTQRDKLLHNTNQRRKERNDEHY